MSTPYSSACYFAKEAASLCKYRGLYLAGFSRLAEKRDGAIWQFIHADSGLVILLNASGAVNQKATKAAAAEAAADLKAKAKAKAAADLKAKPAATLSRVASGFRLYTESGAWIGAGLGLFKTAPAATSWAAANGYHVKPAAAPAAFRLAPVSPALQAPLAPFAALSALAFAMGAF